MNKTASSLQKIKTSKIARIVSQSRINHAQSVTRKLIPHIKFRSLTKIRANNYNPEKQIQNGNQKQQINYPKFRSYRSVEVLKFGNRDNKNIITPTPKKKQLGIPPIKLIAESGHSVKTIRQTEFNRKLLLDQNSKQKNEKNLMNNVNNQTIQTVLMRRRSSSHLEDRSVMSTRIKLENQIRQKKLAKAFDYLLSKNKKYLQEKSRLCCQMAKPDKEIFDFEKSTFVLTTNQEFFNQKDKHLDKQFYPVPQNQQVAFGLPEGKLYQKSRSHESHSGKFSKRPEKFTYKVGWKLEGPIWMPTTYMNHYPHNGKQDKMIPIATWDKALTGLSFAGKTNNKSSYKKLNFNPVKLAKWNNMHPYRVNFLNEEFNKTTYMREYEQKERHPIQQYRIIDYPILKSSKGFFNTSYNSEFQDKSKMNSSLNKYESG